jgi:hypothetical protein
MKRPKISVIKRRQNMARRFMATGKGVGLQNVNVGIALYQKGHSWLWINGGDFSEERPCRDDYVLIAELTHLVRSVRRRVKQMRQRIVRK